MQSSDKKDYHVLSSFWLKIIGMISMIIDHIGVFYERSYASIPNYDINIQLTLRIIGRISFIIFAFLVVEGVTHSRKPWKYLLQLLGLAIICDIGYIAIMHEYYGNPITSLFLGGLIINLLNNKKWYMKVLSLLPITLVILIGLSIIPLKADYCLYGVITILIFYISKIVSNIACRYIIQKYNLVEETFKSSSFYRTLNNGVAVILFISYALIIYILNPIWNGEALFSPFMNIQIYAIFGIIPIIFYNGKRGYNKTWFKYGCYLVYPLHLILIYLIFTFLI